MKREGSTQDLHERARRLVDVERVEGLATEERRWLQDHLAACETCAAWAQSADAALRAFKSVSVALPPALAASARFRVRERAAELKQQRARNAALIAGCALSWLLGVASAPLVWKLCAWLGSAFGLPRIVWELGFAAWWFVPASAAALVIVWARSRAEHEQLGGVR
ncbi:MAG TPA: hypothetical protein VL523_00550 [Terriglobia bacterium]|nr:hypothetical protein [Terriglobia bacterium]